MSRRVVPVSRLVRYIKESMESDPVLRGVMIEGEISNLRIPNSQHWYFSLKDEKASLTCVMFAYQNKKVTFQPKNGDKVILIGDVSVYESMGSMQMVASSMQPSGIGELYLKLEQMKKQLFQEGLFEESHKKQLPEYPMDIALVTGSNTAAREDVLITFRKRWPIAKIHEYPCPVQGAQASPKIIEALKRADEGNHELVILARGGGSLEDLWCFNDEALARTIYAMHTPIVTGIGHETDTTLVDYVSDKRANTPTGAVEVSTPNIVDVKAMLSSYQIRMVNAVKASEERKQQQLLHLATSSVLKNPKKLLNEKIVMLQYTHERLMRYPSSLREKRSALDRMTSLFHQKMVASSNEIRSEIKNQQAQLVLNMHRQLDHNQHILSMQEEALKTSMQVNSTRYHNDLERMVKLLDAYSPLKVLSRGYSVTYKNDKVITDVDDLNINDELTIRLSKGMVLTKVEDIKHGK